MAWPAPMPLVEVDWIDSHARGGWDETEAWEREAAILGPLLMCRSVGYLFHVAPTFLVLMRDLAASGNMAASQAIPLVAVQSWRALA